LADLPKPDFTHGNSLAKIIKKPGSNGHSAYAYRSYATTIRTNRYRFTAHKDGGYELYDHATDPGEAKNIAATQPDIIAELSRRLAEKRSVHK
jgi:iduronate 2-sulfatase